MGKLIEELNLKDDFLFAKVMSDKEICKSENKCNEDRELVLGDETTKIFLNTKGKLDDVDEEMREFLGYVEHSTDAFAEAAKSELVKKLNAKVNSVKKDQSVEVEYMTLLERDREKFEEGREEGRKAEKRLIAKGLKQSGVSIEIIQETTGLSEEEIIKL